MAETLDSVPLCGLATYPYPPTGLRKGMAPWRPGASECQARVRGSVSRGHADHTYPNLAMAWAVGGCGWRVTAICSHLWSSHTTEHAPRHFLYFPLRDEPSHVTLQPTAIDAGPLPQGLVCERLLDGAESCQENVGL